MPLRYLLSGHLLLVPACPRSLAADTRSALPGSQLPATAPASCADTNRPLPLRRLSRCRGLRCNSCLQSPSASGSHATAPPPPPPARAVPSYRTTHIAVPQLGERPAKVGECLFVRC